MGDNKILFASSFQTFSIQPIVKWITKTCWKLGPKFWSHFGFFQHSYNLFLSTTVAPANESMLLVIVKEGWRTTNRQSREAFAGPLTADRRWFADNSGEKGYGRSRAATMDTWLSRAADDSWLLVTRDKTNEDRATRTQIISVEMSGTGNIAEDVSLARSRNQRFSSRWLSRRFRRHVEIETRGWIKRRTDDRIVPRFIRYILLG